MPVVGGARSSYTPIRVAAVAGWFPLRVLDVEESAGRSDNRITADNNGRFLYFQPIVSTTPTTTLTR